MPAILSKHFGVFAANAFSKSFVSDSIYLTIGNPTPWTTPATPDTLVDTTDEFKSAWNRMAGAFRITSDRVAQGIKRNNWTTGIAYEQYNSNIETLGTGNGYYVLAGSNDRSVYKCLDNNYDSKSIVKPTQKDLASYKEIDGYVWKYMYTISEDDWYNFTTTDVIPAKNNPTVSAAAVSGSILNIPVYGANNLIGTGTNYRGSNFANGTPGVRIVDANVASIVSHSASTKFYIGSKDDAIHSSTSGLPSQWFNNCAVMFTSGLSSGRIAKIINYSASDAKVTLDESIPSFKMGDSFIIGPHVTIQDDRGGSGFEGIAVVNSRGNVVSISVGTIGQNYSNTQFSANISYLWDGNTNDLGGSGATPNGAGAYANVYLSPSGGHGYNVLEELNAKYVIVSAETPLAGGTEDKISPDYGMDFHQVGLLRNPINPYTQKIATGQTYDLRTHLLFDGSVISYSQLISNYPSDTIINNANTSATGIVWKISYQNKKFTQLSLVGTEGSFANGQYIQNPSGYYAQISTSDTADGQFSIRGENTQNTVGVYTEQLTKYSGEVIYLNNVEAISRHKDQSDSFKFVFEF